MNEFKLLPKIFNWQKAQEKIPYKVYTALLTQTGTNAPVATVLENTIGNIWFSYVNAGIYAINSNGLFTENKTIVFLGSVGDSDLSAGYTSRVFITDNTNIGISSLVGTGSSFDSVMFNTPIEIRVYN